VPGSGLAFRDPERDLAADLCDLSIQVAHAGLAGVLADQFAQCGIREVQRLQAVLFELPWDEELAGDQYLLVLQIARELDDLHAILQGVWDGVEHVGRGDEHHLGQVKRHLEVVIGERMVLLRIEDFEERRGRVAAKVEPEFVDLVQHEHGILAASAPHGLDNPAGKGAHVSASVPADLGLVPDTAKADAYERAPERLGDGLAKRGLASAGWPDKAEDRVLHLVGRQPVHGNVLEDPLLGFGQTVVALLKYLARLFDVQPVLGGHLPGQLHNPVEIRADHGDLGCRRGHRGQPGKLLFRLFAHLVGQFGLGKLRTQRGKVLQVRIALAEFVLNHAHLLAQKILALALVHFLLNL